MIVWHDEAGEILWTLNPAEGMHRPEGLHIEVEDQEPDLQRHRVVAGQLVARDELTPALREAFISRIRQLRGEVRARDITVLPGQDRARQDKERQGAAFLADPDPDPADYPAIAAEVGITGGSAWEVAQVYVNMAALWRSVTAVIKAATLGALAVVEAAGSLAEAEAAMEAMQGGLA